MFARKSRVSQRPNGLSKRRRHMVTRRSKALQGPSKPLVRRLSKPLMGSLPQPLGSFHEDGNTLLARDPRSTSKPPTCSTMRPTSIVNAGSRAAHRETQGRRGRGTTGAPLTTVETATWSENSRYCPIPHAAAEQGHRSCKTRGGYVKSILSSPATAGESVLHRW